jgi:hypothetical protein
MRRAMAEVKTRKGLEKKGAILILWILDAQLVVKDGASKAPKKERRKHIE